MQSSLAGGAPPPEAGAPRGPGEPVPVQRRQRPGESGRMVVVVVVVFWGEGGGGGGGGGRMVRTYVRSGGGGGGGGRMVAVVVVISKPQTLDPKP